ncbi:MAG: GAF domain-containing protein [Gemmatimonadaceae bacterium]|nr:GAF domain-containing protein [Gemmatimonadaceae bacterium]
MALPLSLDLSNVGRLEALRHAAQSRPFPHPSFDTITRLAARHLDVPMALVSLFDDRQQFFAGATGLTGDLLACRAVPSSHSLCQRVVASQEPLRVVDARLHPDLFDNPAVMEFGVVAYLGVPIITSTGHTMGSLCAIAPFARPWLDADEQFLRDLAEPIAAELELRAELALRDEERRLADPSIDAEGLPSRGVDILENIHEGVISVDRQWRITFVNRRMARILGVERDAAIGLDVWAQFPFLEGTSIGKALRTAATTRFPTHTEAAIPSVRRWFEVRAIPVRHGMSIYVHDVTERREAEAALALREAQLRHAQKMDAIGTLAGGVAHDFNNILAVIRANAELLQSDPTLATDRAEVRDIVQATTRAAGLTRQLLEFSRQKAVRPCVMDVGETLRTLAPVLQRLMPSSVVLETLVDPSAPMILADPGQIEQLLMILVNNAGDAMRDAAREVVRDRGTVHVACTPLMVLVSQHTVVGVLQPGTYLQLRVTDTGLGIAADILPRIFEPFFSTKPNGRGAGLGLATAFGIVQQASGGIIVDTQSGRGTTMRVLLPVAQL